MHASEIGAAVQESVQRIIDDGLSESTANQLSDQNLVSDENQFVRVAGQGRIIMDGVTYVPKTPGAPFAIQKHNGEIELIDAVEMTPHTSQAASAAAAPSSAPIITPLVSPAAITAKSEPTGGSEKTTSTSTSTSTLTSTSISTVAALHAQQSPSETSAPAGGDEQKSGAMIVTVNLSMAAMIAGIFAHFL